MSQFDTAMACTLNMKECLNQNHYELPPYGPIPDAATKLRMAVNNMVDALVIAMAAESNGVTMPPVAELPEAEVEAMRAGVRQEHTLHREYAETLRNLPEQGPQPAPFPLGQLPPEEQERQEQAKQDEERRQQDESEQVARERQAREQAAREQQERERQAAAQTRPPQPPEPDKPANTFA